MQVADDRPPITPGTTTPVAEAQMVSIRIDESGAATVLAATGEIDMTNQGQFRAALETAASSGRRLVVDLTRVTALSSHAIGALYRHADRLTAVYVAGNSVIARALSYSGFASRVPVIWDPRVVLKAGGFAVPRPR